MSIATPLSTSGRFIVDAHDKRVRLAGVNWYGASEDVGVPAGLDCIDRNTLAELIAAQGFNCVRFPFSLWMTEQTAAVDDQYLLANPDLHGSTPIQVYDACVKALTEKGIIVIPNCHLLDYGWCCSETDTNGLWFNDRWETAKFTSAWQDITRRYASNPLVAAMDIKNEPRQTTLAKGKMTPAWGTDELETDFAAMYTTVGNLIHEINPRLLIICEGLDYAGDLTGVASHQVKLAQADKVVYSMHDYTWDSHPDSQTQAEYFEQMNKNGGYILTEGIAPLWLGEFGDNASTLNSGGGGAWWANIQAWLKEYDIDWCWWALNPTHGRSCKPGTTQVEYYWGAPEPYGLLTLDWKSVGYADLLTKLKALMQPHTGPGI